jgi:hypothetical protein
MILLLWILSLYNPTGDGLRFRLFNESNTLVLTDTIQTVEFQVLSNCPYDTTTWAEVADTDMKFNIILDGFLDPLFTEDHTFYYTSSAWARLTIGGAVIPNSGKIPLVKGQKIPITIEFLDPGNLEDNCGGFALQWRSYSQARQDIPTSQLYTGLNVSLPLIDRDRGPHRVPAIKNIKVQTDVTSTIWVQSPKRYSYLFTDITGRELQRGFLFKDVNYIPVSKFTPGVYILSIGGEATYRIIKK